MTDTQLIYFTKIVELGSFSEAALELDISQSSISKQIQQLEGELGVRLFDRAFRKATLTPEGERLYPEALTALRQMKHLKAAAEKLSLEQKKKFTLLALPVIGHYNFYIPIQLFESSHSDYSVELEELEEPEMYRRIRAGDFDVAITYYNPNFRAEHVKFYPVLVDEMVLVCPEVSPLCKQDTVTPDDLNGQPVLAMQKYTCINQLYELYFQKHHSSPRIIFRGRPESILVGAEANRGGALLTRIHTDMLRLGGVSLIPFRPPLKAILGIIVNEEKSQGPLVQELIRTLTQK